MREIVRAVVGRWAECWFFILTGCSLSEPLIFLFKYLVILYNNYIIIILCLNVKYDLTKDTFSLLRIQMEQIAKDDGTLFTQYILFHRQTISFRRLAAKPIRRR